MKRYISIVLYIRQGDLLKLQIVVFKKGAGHFRVLQCTSVQGETCVTQVQGKANKEENSSQKQNKTKQNKTKEKTKNSVLSRH